MKSYAFNKIEKWGKSPFLLVFVIIFSVFSCDDPVNIDPDKPGGDTIIDAPDTSDVCVLVYMAAENSMSQTANYQTRETFVDLDLNEMVRAASQIPLSSRLLVYLDDREQPRLLEINSQEGKVVLETRIEENSTDPATFEEILRHVTTQYPSRRHALVMWSHGSGWIPPARNNTIGIDNLTNSLNNRGSELEIADMRQALDNLNLHFDYIMFDACFMQCIETAYELRHNTDYIIASPAEIPGDGAPYDKIMSCMMNPSEENCKRLVDIYFEDYMYSDGAILSLVKTSCLDTLLQETRQLCGNYYNLAYELNTDGIQPYCSFTHYSSWKPEYFDMASVMNRMLNAADYDTWYQQLTQAVISRHSTDHWLSIFEGYSFSPNVIDPDHLAIVSIHVPNEKYDLNTTYNEAIKKTQWYKDFTSK